MALGTAVVFGMAINAIVGTLFVPGFWELLQNFKEKHLNKLFTSSDKPVKNTSSDSNTSQNSLKDEV